jgi:hypothetical protein
VPRKFPIVTLTYLLTLVLGYVFGYSSGKLHEHNAKLAGGGTSCVIHYDKNRLPDPYFVTNCQPATTQGVSEGSSGGPTHIRDSHGCVDYYSFPGQNFLMQTVKQIPDSFYEVQPSDSDSELCFTGTKDTLVKLKEPGAKGFVVGFSFNVINAANGQLILGVEHSPPRSEPWAVISKGGYCTVIYDGGRYWPAACTKMVVESNWCCSDGVAN